MSKMTPEIVRIYQREFKSQTDAEAFIAQTAVLKDRISAVSMSYRLYQSEDNPLLIFEIWEYPDEDAMEWVQASMEGASAVPRRFSPETSAVSAKLKVAIDITE